MWNKMCLNFRFRVKQWIFIKLLHIVVVANKLSVLLFCASHIWCFYLAPLSFSLNKHFWVILFVTENIGGRLTEWCCCFGNCYIEKKKRVIPATVIPNKRFLLPPVYYNGETTQSLCLYRYVIVKVAHNITLLLCCAGKVDSALRTIWRMAFWTD